VVQPVHSILHCPAGHKAPHWNIYDTKTGQIVGRADHELGVLSGSVADVRIASKLEGK
jgi:hypothetical protein